MSIHFYTSKFPYYLSNLYLQREKELTRESCQVSCHDIQLYRSFWHYKGKYANSSKHRYLPYTNQHQCLFLKVAYTYKHRHMYLHVLTHTCVGVCIYNITHLPSLRTYSNFKQNFTSIVESHMLILKPTITFSWLFFSKRFFS